MGLHTTIFPQFISYWQWRYKCWIGRFCLWALSYENVIFPYFFRLQSHKTRKKLFILLLEKVCLSPIYNGTGWQTWFTGNGEAAWFGNAFAKFARFRRHHLVLGSTHASTLQLDQTKTYRTKFDQTRPSYTKLDQTRLHNITPKQTWPDQTKAK